MYSVKCNKYRILTFFLFYYIKKELKQTVSLQLLCLNFPILDFDFEIDVQQKNHESFEDALRDVGKSSLEVLKSKVGVLQFLGETSANAAVEGKLKAAFPIPE